MRILHLGGGGSGFFLERVEGWKGDRLGVASVWLKALAMLRLCLSGLVMEAGSNERVGSEGARRAGVSLDFFFKLAAVRLTILITWVTDAL